MEGRADARSSRRPLIAATTALAALGAAVALVVLAWAAWRREATSLLPPDTPRGAVVALTLTTGQVYYGLVDAASAHQITLQQVYYVQPELDAAGNARGNRLVQRQRNDWHAPVRMTVAADKVLLVEQVGADSRLRQLMETDRGAAAPLPR